MRAPEPTAMRFNALNRVFSRLIAAWVAIALVLALPLGTTGTFAAGLPVYQQSLHASVLLENDADAIVLPAEARDESDTLHQRPLSSFDDPCLLPEMTSVAVAFSQTALFARPLNRLALPPPGRGPPARS